MSLANNMPSQTLERSFRESREHSSIAVPNAVTRDSMNTTDAPFVVASYFVVKRFVDWCLAATILIVSTPVMLTIAALIFVCNGRPIFYRQQRVGKDGHLFSIWKFRSMRPDAEAATGAIWSTPNDRRVTKLGRWLRTTHLDELPQLFNVISGEMSIVGPRPERPEFVEAFERELPRYSLRHRVRPGITGLAQVKQGYDSSIHDVTNKISYDLEYIQSTSLFRDLTILCWTVPYVSKELMELARRYWNSNHVDAFAAEEKSQPAITVQSMLQPSLELELLQRLEDSRQILVESHQGTSTVPRPRILEDRTENSKILS